MKWFCMLYLGMLCYGFAQTKQDSTTVEKLEEVVVTDTRFAIKRENSGKTVIKISRDEIEKNQGRTISELINTKSGIEITGSRSNAGQNLGVRVRGGDNAQVLVIIDGVQMSDPSQINNEYDLRLLSLDNIESIEIIKGASSTLYGSGATTAVINITTTKASKKVISASLSSMLGTNQSQEDSGYDVTNFINSVNIGGTANKFNYRLVFNQTFSDGISAALVDEGDKDAYSKYSVDLNLGYKFTDNLSVNIYGNITDIDSDFDAGAFTDASNVFTSNQYRLGLNSKYSYVNGSLNLNSSFSSYEREFNSPPFDPFIAEGDNFILDVYNKYNFNKTFYTILGLNVINNQAVLSKEVNFNIIDPYINTVYISDFGLTVNLGGRLNNHSQYGSNFIYNFNPSYVFKPNDKDYIKLLGSYSTSFITPSLSQLFDEFSGTSDLAPEENLTIEGGLEVKLDSKFRASGLYFNRNEENPLIFDNSTFLYINGENREINGIEFEVDFKPIEKLSLLLNYTHILEEDIELVPEQKANINIGYNFTNKTYASVSYQFTGDRATFDRSDFFNPIPVNLDNFSIFNLSFKHTLKNDIVSLYANLENLFNEDYQDILGFTSLGRNVNLGLNLKF